MIDTPETIRNELKNMRDNLVDRLKDISGDEVWRAGVDLAVLLASVGQICADTECEYNRKLEHYRFSAGLKTSAEATIRAEATPEYHDMKLWQYEQESLIELLQALKKRFTEMAEEHKAGNTKIF